MTSSESKLLFEIEGSPLAKLFSFKKHRSYIAVYTDHIHVIGKGEDHTVPLDDIFDVFVKEPVIRSITSRTVAIHFYENGEEHTLNLLSDKTFNGLSEKMEEVMQKEWSRFAEMKQYPDTIQWLIACSAVVKISSGMNPYIYGFSTKAPKFAADQREELKRSWGFTQRNDLLFMLSSLYDGRSVARYLEDLKNIPNLKKKKQKLMEKIQSICGEKSIWAWDLQRLIHLCNLGYSCEYLSYEEALDLSLWAAKKLQSIYTSWDDFMQSYLLGYCFWSNDDLEDEFCEAHARAGMYKYYKNRNDSPWRVDWDNALDVTWEPSGILTSSYISIDKNDKFISVYFNTKHTIPYNIGIKINEIREDANMDNYNWVAFLHYYLSKHAQDIMEELEYDLEDGTYSAYYPLTAEGEERGEKLVGIIRYLMENEDEIFSIVREYGNEIEWE